MRVIVVGAGIGGLALAIALRRAGHDVTVLERAPEIRPIGAGIGLWANAMHALDRLGVRDAVAARGARAGRAVILTADGRELSAVPAELLDGVAIHRGDLQAVLLDAAGDVRLRADVTSVAQRDDRAAATLADGSEEAAELLVGADGVNSVVREALGGARVRYSGYTAWRGVAPLAIESGRLSESWGVGERFGMLDIGRSRTYWFATKNAPEGEPDEPGGRKAELVRRFSGWHDPAPALLEATDESGILRNDVVYLDPLPHWSEGRIVLLGDAAHATTPGIGQGAAQALEDAVVLADALAGGDDIPTALAAYESARRPRTTMVHRQSVRVDRTAQLRSPLGCRLRNGLVRRTPARVQQRQLEPLLRHRV